MTRAAQVTQAVSAMRKARARAAPSSSPEPASTAFSDTPGSADPPAGLNAVSARDRLDAERWLDEGGSFRREAVTPMTAGTLIAPPSRPLPPSNPQSRPLYACPECGHLLRVSGLGRHRVYFELDDERSDHPVMNRVCPQCGHGLPGKNPR